MLEKRDSSLEESVEYQLGLSDSSLIIQDIDNVKNLLRHYSIHNKEICIYINPLSAFDYRYFIDDFKRYYREDCVVVAGSDFDFKVLDADVEGRDVLSFCCHIDRLRGFDGSVLNWMTYVQKKVPTVGDLVADKIGKVTVDRGTGGVSAQKYNVKMLHKDDWYEWMENEEGNE
jgi:hypothetical protein